MYLIIYKSDLIHNLMPSGNIWNFSNMNSKSGRLVQILIDIEVSLLMTWCHQHEGKKRQEPACKVTSKMFTSFIFGKLLSLKFNKSITLLFGFSPNGDEGYILNKLFGNVR